MEFTVDASHLVQAVKYITEGFASFPQTIAPYVLLSAKDGKVMAKVFCRSLHISVDLGPTASIVQEGEYAVHHLQLLAALQAFSGPVTLKRDLPGAVISSQTTHGLQQIRIDGRERTDQFQEEVFLTEGTTCTRSKYVQNVCASCGHSNSVTQVNTYRVQHATYQQARLSYQDLVRMVKQVAWASKKGGYEETPWSAVYLTLTQDCFSLVASDGYCISRVSQSIAGSGNWSQGVLLPTGQLVRAITALPKGEPVRLEVIGSEQQLVKIDDKEIEDGAACEQPLAVRLIAGSVTATIISLKVSFPEYHKLWSETFASSVHCPKGELLEAVAALVPIASRRTGDLRVQLGSPLKVAVEQEELLPARRDIPPLEQEGLDWSFVVEGSYLLGALKAVSAPQVTLAIARRDKPVLLVSESSEGRSYVCMMIIQKALEGEATHAL